MKQNLTTLLFSLMAMMMPIAVWAEQSTAEVLWGTSAQSLTQSGTFFEAINAAEVDATVGYIQLQKDITITQTGLILGGTFTFDLNGYQLASDGYTIDIRKPNTNVTITDTYHGHDRVGKVISTREGASAVMLMDSATVTIADGVFESAIYAIYVFEGALCTIAGGTFTNQKGSLICNDGTLIITDGTIGDENMHTAIASSKHSLTTISGGIFGNAKTATFSYSAGVIDLSHYPTTTETVLPISRLTLINLCDTTIATDSAIVLPEGYYLYDRYFQMADSLSIFNSRYTIATAAASVEAKWGASANQLTNEGTLLEAYHAAKTDATVGYIQLHANVLTTPEHRISGGTFTLDFNGYQLASDTFAIHVANEGTVLTLTDTYDGNSRQSSVNCFGYDQSPVGVFDGADVTINAGTYHPRAFSCVWVGDGTAVTVTGGTFIDARNGIFYYQGGTLDLSHYPTTDTKGTTPLDNIYVYNTCYTLVICDSTILLPEGYCFAERNREVTILDPRAYWIYPSSECLPPALPAVATSANQLVGTYDVFGLSAFYNMDEQWVTTISQDATDPNKLWMHPVCLFGGLSSEYIQPVYMLFDPATGTLTLPMGQCMYQLNDTYDMRLAFADMDNDLQPNLSDSLTLRTYQTDGRWMLVISDILGVLNIVTYDGWYQALTNIEYTKRDVDDVISGIEDFAVQSPSSDTQKILRDGQVIIIRDGVEYNLMGQPLR